MLEVGGSKPSPPTRPGARRAQSTVRAHSAVRLEKQVTPRGIDEYLAALDEQKRTTLQQLRQTILAVIPNAEECISYGMPAFRLDGKVIAGFAAFKNHLSYLPHSGSVFPAIKDEVASYKTSTGALQFPIESSLPKPLVERLVRTRIAQAFPEG